MQTETDTWGHCSLQRCVLLPLKPGTCLTVYMKAVHGKRCLITEVIQGLALHGKPDSPEYGCVHKCKHDLRGVLFISVNEGSYEGGGLCGGWFARCRTRSKCECAHSVLEEDAHLHTFLTQFLGEEEG